MNKQQVEQNFQDGKKSLPAEHRAMVEKAEAAGRKHGAGAAMRQTIRNAHGMLNDIEDALNDAKNDTDRSRVMAEGVAKFEAAISFIKAHSQALTTGIIWGS